MRNQHIEIHPVSQHLGAVITGVDLSEPRADDNFEIIHQAFLEHQVIMLPGQAINPDQHVAFARRFGEIDEPHPVFPHLAERPEITIIEQRGEEGYYNDGWHTDVSSQECPPLGSILHARILPPYGGDTCWASMYRAYEALSEPVKRMLEGLEAEHDFAYAFADTVVAGPGGHERLREIREKHPPVLHPVVRTHPVTGRRALFVNGGFTSRIRGLSRRESQAILDMLIQHAANTSFQIRHHWHVDDLVMWDNRCTQHFALRDFHPHHRRMHRITLRGDRPA